MEGKEYEGRRHKVIAFLNFVALVFVLLTLDLKIWWEMGRGNNRQVFGLFTKVTCTKGVCSLTSGDECAAMAFIKIALILSVFLGFISVAGMLIFIWKQTRFYLSISGGFSGSAGFMTFLVGLVMVIYYHQIGKAWWPAHAKQSPLNQDPIVFQSVAMFLIFMSGALNFVSTVFTLVRLGK